MANTKSTNIRFNLDREVHRKAWDYLHTMDEKIFPSITSAVILAVVDYFDRYYVDADADKQKSDELLARTVAKAVEQTIEASLPAFLAGYFAGTGPVQPLQLPTADPEPPELQISEEDIAWDFLQDA